MLRIVPDTNVLISAFITKGNEFSLIKLAKEGEIKLFITPEILEEFNDVIKRPKFGFSEQQIANFNSQILLACQLVNPLEKLEIIKEDPDDDRILECAVEAKTNYIVSGDKHLLRLKEFRGIKILNASDLLDLV